jgi:hypothetical protein
MVARGSKNQAKETMKLLTKKRVKTRKAAFTLFRLFRSQFPTAVEFDEI